MTTFGTYTPFLPFTLGRAVFQFDKAFHESRAVETSSLRGRKSIFLRARKRRETEISVRIALYTVSWNAHFRIHINVSELFVKIQPTLRFVSYIYPIAPTTFVYILCCDERTKRVGRGELWKKWRLATRRGFAYKLKYSCDFGKEKGLYNDINGIVTLWKLFSRG